MTVMPTDGPLGSGGCGGKRRLGASCNSSSVRSAATPVSSIGAITCGRVRVTSVGVGGRGFLDALRWDCLNPVNGTVKTRSLVSSCCLRTRENLTLTVFVVQHPAAHGLFNFLLAAQPHTIQPGAGMVLVHEIAVEPHHCGAIRGHFCCFVFLSWCVVG